MDISPVAVYSEVDADSLHVKLADEAYPIGPAETIHSYLDAEKILEVARMCKADAIHPGYGFLAENPGFVEKCEQQGLTFIGPPSQSMYKVKPKHAARNLMKLLNIPVVPGCTPRSARFAKNDGSSVNIPFTVLPKCPLNSS